MVHEDVEVDFATTVTIADAARDRFVQATGLIFSQRHPMVGVEVDVVVVVDFDGDGDGEENPSYSSPPRAQLQARAARRRSR